MTSNLGSQGILGANSPAEARQFAESALHNHFPPEFINRLEEIIVFNPLRQEDLQAIVDIHIRRFNARLGSFAVELDSLAKEHLARSGYQPEFGARPLRRAIRRELEDPMAMYILSHGRPDGGVVRVTADESGLVILPTDSGSAEEASGA